MSEVMVSVCMITFNHEAFIREAIEGVLLQQTSFPYELVIGEDCSTDRTREICNEYQQKHPDKIRLLLNEKNLGMMSNFIQTLKACTGKYIALCEGDDYWTDPLKLQKQVEFLEGNEEYVMCWTRFKTKKEPGNELNNDNNQSYFEKNPEGVLFDFEKFFRGWHIGLQTLMFRKDAIDFSKSNEWKNYKDVVMITELLNAGKGYCLNEFTAVYRQHMGGVYSGMNEINRAKGGQEIYKEIFLKNKNNNYLKLKYLRFSNSYLSLLREKRKLYEPLKRTFEQFFHTKDLNSFKHNLKMLIHEVLKSILK